MNDASRFALAHAAQRVVVDRERVGFVDRPDVDLAQAPSFALKRLSRDDRREVLKADPYPRGRELVLHRGQAEEHLERVPNGVEHSFHFASKPSGEGELVVDLETSGLRLLGADAQGLHFRAGDKLIHYGTATWVDAKGAKSPVALSHAKGSIQLRVAAKVLEGSAYPAVLDPLIQTEFIVAHAQKEQPVPSRSGCTANQCLHVWNDGHFVFGRRTSFSGDWVEPEAHRLMRGDYYPQRVSAEPNGDYLVTVSLPNSAAVTGFVVHSDMSVDSDAPDLLYANDSDQYMQQPGFEGAVVSQGVHHLFYQAWNGDESELHRFVLRVKDGEALGPPIDLGKLDDNYEVPSFSAGATSVIVTQNNRVVRMDAATGDLLDASPVKVSDLAEDAFASRLSSAFDGENFVIFWTNSNTGRVHAARLRESDGVLLDAQGVAATGSRTLCSSFISYANVDGNVDGDRVQLLLWKGSGDPFPTAVVATSVATDGWASSDAACGGTELGAFPRGPGVVFGGNQVRLGDKAITFANDGVTSQALPVPGFTTSRRFGGVVSNGRDFLLLSEPIERIDGATGALLGSVTVPNVASVGASQVFPDGADYLVRSDDRTIRRLRCDGTLGATHRSQLEGLSCNGEHCLGWINYTRYQETAGNSVAKVAMTDIFRFDRSGKSIGTSVARFNNGYSDQPSGAGALAVGSGSNRQFVLTRPIASTPGSTALTLIDSSTGLVSEVTFPAPNESFTLATDGAGLGWFYPNEARLTDLVGNTLAQRSFEHSWTGKPPRYQAQIFDGFSYLIRTSTKVVLLDTSLQDLQQLAFQETNVDEADKQYYASNSFGRTLFARTAYVDEDAGQAVVAQFLDNDLAPADPSNAPSNCAVSGPIDEQPNAYAAVFVTTGNGGTGGSAGSNATGGTSPTGGTGGSTDAGGSAANGGSAGTDSAAGADGGMPSAEGGTSAEGGSGATAATDSGGDASAVGGSGGASHAGTAAVPPRKNHTESTRGGCSYAPSSASHNGWLWLLGLVAVAQRRRRAD